MQSITLISLVIWSIIAGSAAIYVLTVLGGQKEQRTRMQLAKARATQALIERSMVAAHQQMDAEDQAAKVEVPLSKAA